jgi:NNP family nitrate/nitrite transporter-like MFS transporter
MGAIMTCPGIVAFTIGALGMAVTNGVGNGAVFKLVPEHFPRTVGTVTGIVGAVGAIGGFFPPIALGFIHQITGDFSLGFVLLSLFSLSCFATCALAVPHSLPVVDDVHI